MPAANLQVPVVRGWHRAAILIVILVMIWIPEVSHFWVTTPSGVQRVATVSRAQPADEVLDRIIFKSFFESGEAVDPNELVGVAERILQGEWQEPMFGKRGITIPFDSDDLELGWPTQQLQFASLVHVGQLLDAFEITQDPRFLAASRDIINAWSTYERRALLNRGYLWNDHAIAQRIVTLVRYWRHFRSSPLYDDASGSSAVQWLLRSGRMLTKAGHFTARSNHGVMQNVALLHLAAALPEAEDSESFRAVAVQRLQLQLAYYQSAEGVVLEHSPGYHHLGVRLLSLAANHLVTLGEPLARDIEKRLALACAYLREVRRPDGTLPLVGNTAAAPHADFCADLQVQAADSERRSPSPGDRLQLFPISGHAVVWARSTQTFVTWSNFATRAHKHDDEMSIVTWSKGGPMLTGAGYWPYGHRLQKDAISWRGSNAPHRVSEPASDVRWTAAERYFEGQRVIGLDLRRGQGVGEAEVSRSVFVIDGSTWVVIDSASPSHSAELRTVWTLFPNWQVESTNSQAIAFVDSASGLRLYGTFLGPTSPRVASHQASSAPFGGWVAQYPAPYGIRAAEGVEARVESGTAIISVWRLADEPAARGAASLVFWRGTEDWEICIYGDPCRWLLARSGAGVILEEGELLESVEASQLPSTWQQVKAIDAAYRAAVEEYPAWRYLAPWRTKASLAFLLLFVAQEMALGFLTRSRYIPKRIASVAPLGASVVVGVLGICCIFFYLR